MKGLCTELVPEHNTLHELLCFRDDLPSPLDAPLAKKDVVVRVHTASLSVDDIHGAEGTFLSFRRTSPRKNVDRDHPYIPGFECCGEVVKAGEEAVKEYPAGSKVVCFQTMLAQRFGTWGEYCVFSPRKASIDVPLIIPKPDHLTDEQAVAAGVPLRVATCTLSKQVYRQMTASPNDKSSKTIVVIGAGGAIGSVLLQAIRHEWPDAQRIAICSSSKRDFALTNGASKVIAYNEVTDWSTEEEIQGKADVVLDLIGGPDSFERGRRALRRGGVFNTTVGPEKFIGDRPLAKHTFLSYVFVVIGRVMANAWRRSYKYYALDMNLNANKSLYHRLLEDDKAIRPVVDSVLDIEDIQAVRQAVQRVRHHETKGRLVLRVSHEEAEKSK